MHGGVQAILTLILFLQAFTSDEIIIVFNLKSIILICYTKRAIIKKTQ